MTILNSKVTILLYDYYKNKYIRYMASASIFKFFCHVSNLMLKLSNLFKAESEFSVAEHF